jgi:hypothetical protein
MGDRLRALGWIKNCSRQSWVPYGFIRSNHICSTSQHSQTFLEWVPTLKDAAKREDSRWSLDQIVIRKILRQCDQDCAAPRGPQLFDNFPYYVRGFEQKPLESLHKRWVFFFFVFIFFFSSSAFSPRYVYSLVILLLKSRTRGYILYIPINSYSRFLAVIVCWRASLRWWNTHLLIASAAVRTDVQVDR